MCGGDGGAGAARAAAAQQAAEYDKQLAQVEAQNKTTVEAMKKQYTPAPVDTMATVSSNYQGGVETNKSRKRETFAVNKGTNSLKIPLNSGSSSSGNSINLG